MRFPDELWPELPQGAMVRAFVEAFSESPIILTDRLLNSVYFTEPAERLFAERAEAIVNRLALSLLGFGEKDRIVPGLVEALSGTADPWEGIVNLQAAEGPLSVYIQASSIRERDGQLIAGIIRIGKVQQR